MSQITQITQDAWMEARPAIALPTIARGYAYAGASALVLVLLGSFLVTVFDIPLNAVFGLLVGLFLFSHYAKARALGNFLSIHTTKADRAQSTRILKQTIAEYAARAPDWDGMEGTAPRPDAIADALAFIDSLPDDIRIPIKVYAPGDGEVTFQWIESESFVEVGFYGDDTISWYARVPGKQDSHGDDRFERRLGRHIPQTLLEALRSMP